MIKDKCIISGRDTVRVFDGRFFAKEVLDFGKWYRDKLNIEQKEKAKEAANLRIDKAQIEKSYVDLRSCLNTFIKMKNKGYAWENIKITLCDELSLKGLLSYAEFDEKTLQ